MNSLPEERRVAFVDGIRAIAILGVIGFHCDIPHARGGYLGVDVFFALSGFLIIGMIQRALDRRGFSVFDFYGARALRIGPPLVLVVLFILAAGCLIDLTPFELQRYGKTGAATLALVPNIYFQQKFGYFEPTADQQPFLHMWSLGVEEQFYAVVPWVLVALAYLAAKRSARNYVLLAIVLALGLAASLFGFLTVRFPVAFYSTPTRMWEFAAGGLVAVGYLLGFRAPKWSANLFICAGLVLIVAPMVWVDAAVRFPGPIAILPVMGTALVVFAGYSAPQSAALRWLGQPMLAAIGLISYSWYLWHWSLLVLLRTYLLGHRYFWLDLSVCAFGSAALAAITYYTVERPCRDFRHSPRFHRFNKRILVGAGAVAAVSVALCLGYEAEMKAQAQSPEFASTAAALARSDEGLCHEMTLSKGGASLPVCELGEGHRSVVIWGDSLAASLVYGANEFAERYDARVFVVSKNSCIPLLDVNVALLGRVTNECSAHNAAVAAALRSGAFGNSPTILLIAHWPEYGVRDGTTIAVAAGSDHVAGDYSSLVRVTLGSTLAFLSQASAGTVVVGPLPQWLYPAPLCLTAAKLRDLRPNDCAVDRAAFENQQQQLVSVLEAATRDVRNVEYIDPINAFCDERLCSPVQNGVALFNDTTHLNDYGSAYLFAFLRTAAAGLYK